MNPETALALILDLYGQLATAQQRIQALQQHIEALEQAPKETPEVAG